MPIEFLTEENLAEGVAIAEQSHRESIWKDYPFDREIIERNLRTMIGNKRWFVAMYRKEKIVGFFCAHLGQFLFSDRPFGIESGVYVAPEYRASHVAQVLYDEFAVWCELNKAEPFVEVYYGENNESAYAFFKRQNLVECGRVFKTRTV
jgi:GNAT superfamily N-acetyltransferase